MKGGAVCYLSARVDEPQLVDGDDSPIYPYVVVMWTHDGSGALQARRTSARPVCWNTISQGRDDATCPRHKTRERPLPSADVLTC